MPQATDELRRRMQERFGDTDDYGPWKFLQERGYTAPQFLIHAPIHHKVTTEEGECIDFLCDEWDWVFVGTDSSKGDDR